MNERMEAMRARYETEVTKLSDNYDEAKSMLFKKECEVRTMTEQILNSEAIIT
jgi:hypothetical protein